jgi:branched-chain amino acid aminotransferase
MKEYKQYLNGRFVPESELLISPRDLGFTRGYGVFEYIRTYNGVPFNIKEHVERLLASADLIKLNHNFNFNLIDNAIKELLRLNDDGQEKSIRVHLSGGVSSSMFQTGKATILIFMDPFKSKNPNIYTEGVALNTVKYARELPSSKNVNYIQGMIQAHINKDKGFFEPLYYSDTQVFETSNSNIFAVKDGKIYTPKNNIFYGSARNLIVNNLSDNFEIIEQDFDLFFLLKADEVFLASGGKQVAPVVRIDNIIIGKGEVGKVTLDVWQKFKEFTSAGNW